MRGKALHKVISKKPDCIYLVHTLFPGCLWLPEELSLQIFCKQKTQMLFALLLWSRYNGTQLPAPSHLHYQISSFIDGLNKSTILFNLLDSLTVHCSLFGSKLLEHYNPVSTKYSVPSSYLNEHSFAGPMCFNTFSPCTAALRTCHKWKADTTYKNTKGSFKNRGLHKKDWSTEFNIYTAQLTPCLKVLPELGSFLQAFGRIFYSYLKTLCIFSYKHSFPVSYMFSTSFTMEKGELLALRPGTDCTYFIPLADAEWWREDKP